MLKIFPFIIVCFQIITAGGCKKMKKEENIKKNVTEENNFVKENIISIPRDVPFKNVKKHILYIILEFTGGHYNLMLCDRRFYAFMKNMSEKDYVHLIKFDALEAFVYSPNAYANRSHTWNVRAEHSLSKDEKVLVTKRVIELPLRCRASTCVGIHYNIRLIEAYDESFFPVLLKYKEIYFALEDRHVNCYYFYALNPKVCDYIELEVDITKDERFFLEHNALPNTWYDQHQRSGTRKIFMDDEIWYTSFLNPETSKARRWKYKNVRNDTDTSRRWNYYTGGPICFTLDMKDVTFVTIPFKDAIEKFRNFKI